MEKKRKANIFKNCAYKQVKVKNTTDKQSSLRLWPLLRVFARSGPKKKKTQIIIHGEQCSKLIGL